MGYGRPDRFEVDPEKLRGLLDDDFTVPDLDQQAPDEIGYVEGWRAWNVELEPPLFGTCPKLESATYQYWWRPRVKARAECKRCSDVPGETCTCGFYSAKTLEHLRSMGYHTYDSNSGMITVVGRLACWGKVVEGGQGWRTEYAYPAKLWLPFEGWRLGKPLAKGYGCAVGLMNLLDPTKFPEEARIVDEGELGADDESGQ